MASARPPGRRGSAGERIERSLDYAFADRELLLRALTHRSYAHEAPCGGHNEPLEFLGDAVLGFLVAERILRRRPDLDEGGMTRLRSSLVNAGSLAAEAARIGLGRALLLGRGEEGSGGRGKASLLADAFEALVGAMFLDGGIRPVRSLVRRLFGERIDGATSRFGAGDAKTELQELFQSRGWVLPRYRLVEQSGPDHAREFVVEVVGGGHVSARGAGTSKKRAEQAAAAAALEEIRGTV